MSVLKNQKGMASIMFAMFMVILLSLLAVGFATIATKDQRQVLDKTLSNQAQYAAETAINRQAKVLKAAPATPAQATCVAPTPASSHVLLTELPNVTITCLKWENKLPNVRLDNVGVSGPVPVPLKFSANTSSMDVSWSEVSGGATGTYGGATLAFQASKIPTLRLTIAASNNVGAATTLYITPTAGGGTMSAASDGAVGSAQCSGSPITCKITINNLPGGGTDYYASIASLNGTSTVTIAPTGGGVTVSGAQVEIDATAKSEDVIKRLTARISLTPTTWSPGFAAEAGTLCKNFLVDGTNTSPGPAFGSVCSN